MGRSAPAAEEGEPEESSAGGEGEGAGDAPLQRRPLERLAVGNAGDGFYGDEAGALHQPQAAEEQGDDAERGSDPFHAGLPVGTRRSGAEMWQGPGWGQ